jgi:hypothetical protein
LWWQGSSLGGLNDLVPQEGILFFATNEAGMLMKMKETQIAVVILSSMPGLIRASRPLDCGAGRYPAGPNAVRPGGAGTNCFCTSEARMLLKTQGYDLQIPDMSLIEQVVSLFPEMSMKTKEIAAKKRLPWNVIENKAG